MKQRVWIDTDMGFDDLWAILTVLGADGLIVDGIGLVAGNSPLPNVIDQACRAKACFGWPFPLHAGRSLPLVAAPIDAGYVLGPSGMRTVGGSLPPAPRAVSPTDAVTAMAEWLRATPQPSTILALGPLTNMAALLLAHGELRNRIAEVVLMGGSTDRGNHTAAAEFNIAADPEAAAVVLASGVPIRMVGLNACRLVTTGMSDVHQVRAGKGPQAALLGDLLEGYVRIAGADGSRPMAVYDPVAAAALVDQDCIRFAPARVEIELQGRYTRGMTVTELRVPAKAVANAAVAVDVDAQRVRSLVLRALGG